MLLTIQCIPMFAKWLNLTSVLFSIPTKSLINSPTVSKIKRNQHHSVFSLSISSHHPEKPHGTRLWRRHALHRVSFQDVCDCPVSFLWTTCSQPAFVPLCKHKPNRGGRHRLCLLSCYWGSYIKPVWWKVNVKLYFTSGSTLFLKCSIILTAAVK